MTHPVGLVYCTTEPIRGDLDRALEAYQRTRRRRLDWLERFVGRVGPRPSGAPRELILSGTTVAGVTADPVEAPPRGWRRIGPVDTRATRPAAVHGWAPGRRGRPATWARLDLAGLSVVRPIGEIASARGMPLAGCAGGRWLSAGVDVDVPHDRLFVTWSDEAAWVFVERALNEAAAVSRWRVVRLSEWHTWRESLPARSGPGLTAGDGTRVGSPWIPEVS